MMLKNFVVVITAILVLNSCTPHCIKVSKADTNEAIEHINYLIAKLNEFKSSRGHFPDGISSLINHFVRRSPNTTEAGEFWRQLPAEWKEKLQGNTIKTERFAFTLSYKYKNEAEDFSLRLDTDMFQKCYIVCWYNSKEPGWTCSDMLFIIHLQSNCILPCHPQSYSFCSKTRLSGE